MVRRDAEEERAARGDETSSLTIDRFEVLEVLGRGGMGIVYRARDPRLGRDVAIKVLSAACKAPAELSAHQTIDLHAPGPPAHDELIAEARMMAQLSHPNVLAVYEVGLDREAMFLVMEYVAGSNLRDWLASSPRERAEILEVFAQAGRGLVAAHACGIVHRDFKPENVLVGADRVRVADFGLSRLVRSPGALIQVADERGTPEYMAPELWQGGAATARSDAFAFCTALVEGLLGQRPGDLAAVEPGLRERGVSADVSAAIRAGLDDDPARRPELSRLVALLDDRPRRPGRRRILAIAGAAVAAGAVAIGLSSSPTDVPACRDDSRLLAGRWDAEQRDKLRSYLEANPALAAIEGTQRVLAMLDNHAREITAVRTATCAAAGERELTAAQVATRMSCLERRAVALGVIVQELRTARQELDTAEERVQSLPYVPACTEITAPAIRDPDRTAALESRYRAIPRLPSKERASAYADLESEALAAGELELEIRATIGLGRTQRASDPVTSADETMQRAYRRALEIRADGLAALALVERVHLARRDSPAAAESLAQLALALAQRPGVSPQIRVRIHGALGRAAASRGDDSTAVERLRHALDLIAKHGLGGGFLERETRSFFAATLVAMDGYHREAQEQARALVALAKRTSGEHSVNYGKALSQLGATLRAGDDTKQGLEYQRQAVEVLSSALPPDHSTVMSHRGALAWYLHVLGHYEEARRESSAARALCVRKRRPCPSTLAILGASTFALGEYDEGIRLIEEAVVESTSRSGKDHDATLTLLRGLMQCQLELGRVAPAMKLYARIEESYRANPRPPRDTEPITLRGILGAELAIIRGKPRQAEALARTALLELLELDKAHRARAGVLAALGRSLVAQRRWAEAKAVLAQAVPIARAQGAPADYLAAIEIPLARAEYGSGAREAGLERARRARDVLANVASQPKASAEVAAFLAKHDRPVRRARHRRRAGGVGDGTAGNRQRPR